MNQYYLNAIPTRHPARIDRTGTRINGVQAYNVDYAGTKVHWPVRLNELTALKDNAINQVIYHVNPRLGKLIRTPYSTWYKCYYADTWKDLDDLLRKGQDFWTRFDKVFPKFAYLFDKVRGSPMERAIARTKLVRWLSDEMRPRSYGHSLNLTDYGVKEQLDCIRNFPKTDSTLFKIMRTLPCGMFYLSEVFRALLRNVRYSHDYEPLFDYDDNEALHFARVADEVTPDDLTEIWTETTRRPSSPRPRQRRRRHWTRLTAHAASHMDNSTKEMNTTFSDQREVVTDTGYVSGQVRSTGQSVAMDEKEWHVRDYMRKPILIKSMGWSTSNAFESQLLDLSLPGEALAGYHTSMLGNFVFLRGHPKIRIQINGTKFHSGRLMAVFVPRYRTGYNDDNQIYVSALTTLPHVILDASFSNSGVLELPFVHQNSYFNTFKNRPWQTLGNLRLYVFNTLKTATTTSQSIDVAIWLSFEDCELHLPCESHTVALPLKAQMESLAMAEAGSAALNTAKELVETTVGDVVGGVTNCDKPTDPIEISRWVPNAVTSMAYGEGIDRSYRLGLQPTGFTLPSADLISTTNDDMNLKEIAQIPTRLRKFDWTTADTTFLRQFPVTPVYCSVNNNSIDTPTYYPTMLAYCARPFRFWRGSLKYKIQVVASQMHTGRLLVAYSPGMTPPGSSVARMSYYNTYVIDLQEKSEVEFTLNFMCEKPWLRCDKFIYDLLDQGDNNSSLGTISLGVLNRLAGPESVATSVEVNVFVSAGEDFELACPSEIYCVNYLGDYPKSLVAHSLMTQDTVTTRTDTGNNSLTHGGTIMSDVSNITMGENCMNLKTLLRRYESIMTRTSSIDKTWLFGYIQFPNSPNLAKVNREFSKVASDATAGMTARTHLAHFSELFTFWRGSLRYKLIFTPGDTGKITVTAFHIPGMFGTATYSFGNFDEPHRKWLQSCTPLGVCVGSSNVQSSLEFEVPFFTQMTQLETNSGAQADMKFDNLNSTGTIVLMIDNPSGASFKMNYSIYQAAGDDFGLNYLRFPPKLTMNRDHARDITYNAKEAYTGIYPVPIYITTGPPTDDDEKKKDLVAHAFTDHFKPSCFSKAERLFDTAQGMLDRTVAAVSTVVNSGGSAPSGQGIDKADDVGESSDDDPDPKTPTNMNMIGGWLTTVFKTLADYLKSAVGIFPDSIFSGLSLPTMEFDVAGVVNALTSFISCKNLFTRACALYTILKMILGTAITKFSDSAMNLIVEIVEGFYGSKKHNELPKAHAEYFDFAGPMAAILSIGTFVMTLARLPSSKEVSNTIKSISEKLRLFNFATLAFSNIQKLYTGITSVVSDLMEWVVLKLDPDWLPRIALIKDFDKIEEWAAFVDSLRDKDISDMVNYDLDFKNKVLKCVDQALHYRVLLAKSKLGREAKYIYDLTTLALDYGQKVKEAKSSLPIRTDPCCVCFTGPTGIGKSTLATSLAADVMDRLDYPLHNRWCVFNPNEKFASENYSQQSSIYIDDIAAFNTPEQWQTFFNLKANTQLPLNMAFQKGKFFESDFIWTTTNVPYPAPNCIAHMPALLRRRNFLIEGGFASDEIARRALSGENVIEDDNSHAEFRFLDPSILDQPLSDWMTYTQMVDQLAYLSRTYLQKQREIVHKGLTAMHYIVSDVVDYPIINNPKLMTSDVRGMENELEAHVETKDDDFVPSKDNVFSQEIKYYPSYHLVPNFPFFAATSPGLFDALSWNGEYFECTDSVYLNEFNELKALAEKEASMTGLPENWDKSALTYYLLQVSYHTFNRPMPDTPTDDPNDKRSRWTLIKEKLMEWKRIICSKISGYFAKHKMLLDVVKTIGYTIAVGLAFLFVTMVVEKVVHKCACAAMNHFGYRCGLCGRWPKLNHGTSRNTWLKAQWKLLFGDLPYKGGTVTPIEEENTLRAMRLLERINNFHSGTAAAHATYSSTDVAGQKTVKVFANMEHANGLLTGPNQHVQTVRDVACKAMYTIRSPEKHGGLRMSGIAVGGRDLLVPRHFFTNCEDGDVWHILHDGAWLPLTLDYGKMRTLTDKDACIVELPVRFHAHKDLSKHFISEKELSYVKKTACTMVKLGFDQRNYIFQGDCERCDETRYTLEMPDKEVPIRTVNLFSYKNIPVTNGECGSLLLTHSSKVSGVILGFHVAGSDRLGMTTVITREMLKGIMTGTQKLGTPTPEVVAHCSALLPSGHFGLVGTVKRSDMVMQSTKTQIIPTKIFEKLSPHVTEPSVLSVKDERLEEKISPLRKGIAKYGKVALAFEERKLDLIEDFLNSKIDCLPRIRKPSVLSVEEAITGFPELEGYEALPMNTSPGWPFVLTRPKGELGKGYLFNDERNKITDLGLSSKLEQRLTLAKRGERIQSVWVDCLKDERRPLAKIKSGSTRVFTIPPVDFSIMMRMYTLDFCEALRNGRDSCFSKVGMNTQSLEWTQLYKTLKANSNYCIAGDYTAYDGTIPPELILRFFRHVYYFHTGTTDLTFNAELWNVLSVLCDESIHTVHLAKDQCYVTHKGNKSGSPITVILNTIIGEYYLCYAWLMLAKRNNTGLTLWNMDQNVEVAIYGDDNLFTVKAGVLEWFNQESISALLSEYGITYTNESKTGITKFKDLDEATFLKNAFGTSEEVPLLKVPLMSTTTIMELINWTRIAPDQDALLRDNIQDALRFSYFYGKQFYNDLRTRINDALRSEGLVFPLCPYSDMDSWFKETCGMISS